VLNAEGNHFLDYRLTLDYAEDFVLLSRLINECSETDLRSYSSIIRYLNDHPEVRAINEKYLGVNWYRNVGDELTTVDSSQWRTYDN
jgi:spore coat polysaccharide biosynthesis protein SpsF